jgi:sporulation protein YlmC with PRC-barrel domain
VSELERKTLKGSGGHIIADLTPQEIKKARLVGAELFLGALGRVSKERIASYYCKNCNRDYDGPPEIRHEKVGQEVAKGYTLSEQGEYLCKKCGSLIAQYKTFAEQAEQRAAASTEQRGDYASDGFVPIRKLVGMSVYDSNAYLQGSVKEIGLRQKSELVMVITTTEQTEREIRWGGILRIGDIILLRADEKAAESKAKCGKCGLENKPDSKFCEQCGNKLA